MPVVSVCIFLLLWLCVPLAAQIPLIAYRGVVNAASRMPTGLPAGAIARGSVFAIAGQNLGPAKEVSAAAYPLDKTLGGVGVRVVQGSTTLDAIPLYVSPGLIHAVMPSNAPLGLVSLQITYNNFRSSLAPVRVVETSVGMFSMNGAGFGPAVAQTVAVTTDDDGNTSTALSANSPAAPAKPGQQVILWATGLGASAAGDTLAPTPNDPATPVEVWVGGKSVQVVSSGRSACCSSTGGFGFGVPAEVTGAAARTVLGPGTDQVVVQLPDDVPAGCYLPVQLRAAKLVSNTVTIAVSADGSPCTDPLNPLSQQLTKGKIGVVTALRTALRFDVNVPSPRDAVVDTFAVSLRQETGSPFAFNPLIGLPPAGSCTTYTAVGDLFDGTDLPGTAPTGKYLDGGATMDLTTDKASRRITLSKTASLHMTPVGLSRPGTPLKANLFLEPGDVQTNSNGGPDVGRVRAKLTMSAPLTWTNRDKIATIDRTQPLALTWTGAAAGKPVGVLGMAVDRPTNASVAFVCVAAPDAAGLTVPSWVLANLPPTRKR